MKGYLETTSGRFQNSDFCRELFKIFVIFILIQGVFLWNLSGIIPKKLKPGFPQNEMQWMIGLFAPREVFAASPIANAGPNQTANLGQTIQLDGSASSDPDGDPLSFDWNLLSVPSGSGASLSNTTSVNPTFSIDLPGTYIAELRVGTGGSGFFCDVDSDGDVDMTDVQQVMAARNTPSSGSSDPRDADGNGTINILDARICSNVMRSGNLSPLPGESATDTVTINTQNSRPVADAGMDQTVFVNDTVILDGSASSDVDGDVLSFSWSLMSAPMGSSAFLVDATFPNPTFVQDLPGNYVVQLIVNDGTVDSAPDTVTISTQNSPPVSDAGTDQTIFIGDTVMLDGSGSSDVDGDPISFSWSLTSAPAGSVASLSGGVLPMPSLIPDLAGSYVVQLIVNDGTVNSTPDTVIISTQNSAPMADAGLDQSVLVGETVKLNGSGSSDVDGDVLTFSWSLISVPLGSAAVISDPTAVMPSFDIDLSGTYIAQLIVSDSMVDSVPDTVTIRTQNSLPVADAGLDQSVFSGAIVTLDGNGSSDSDGDSLSFSWSLISHPAGSSAFLPDPTASVLNFLIDLPGDYIVQLIVNDGIVDSVPDTMMVSTVNSAPVANAGPDQNVIVGATVTLDGNASDDADGDSLSFSWSLTVVPVGSTAILIDPTTPSPSFSPDLPGDYMVQLIVNDGKVNSAPDAMMVTALQLPPEISINDVSVIEGDTGTTNAVFTVTLSHSSTQTVTVGFATADDTALAGSDYDAVSGTLIFSPGETSQGITVLINGDVVDVTTERFFVDLSSPLNSIISDPQGVGTIVNDEFPLAF